MKPLPRCIPRTAINTVAASLIFNELSPEDGYDAFDADEDGQVSLSDLQSAVESLSLDISEQDVKGLFVNLDAGTTGFIPKAAWVQAIAGADADAVLRARGLMIEGKQNKSPAAVTEAANHTQKEVPMSDEVLRDMDRLAAMGFLDVDQNLVLLQKHNNKHNNVEAVLNDLLGDVAQQGGQVEIQHTLLSPPSGGEPQAPILPSNASSPLTASVEQQQLSSRLTDIVNEPLALLSPITGVSGTLRQPVMDAAIASGVPDMDAHGFIASEHGAAQARILAISIVILCCIGVYYINFVRKPARHVATRTGSTQMKQGR